MQVKLAVKGKGKLTRDENGQKNALQCKQRHHITHCKPETKTGDSSNGCVCLSRSLELLTVNHNHSDFLAA